MVETTVVRVEDLVKQGAVAISDGYRMRNEELGPTGIPFVRGGDIGDGWIVTDTEDHIRAEFADRVQSKLARPGDVAFITKGNVGRVGRLRAGQPSVVFAPQVAYWRVLDENVLSPTFLYYLLRGPAFQAELHAVKTHGAMVADYVSISQQLGFTVALPTIGRQRVAGHILGALDDKIELLRRMNETLEETCQALFQSSSGSPSLGETSQDLSNLVSYLNRGLSPTYVESGGVRVLNQKCVRGHRIDAQKARRHDPTARSIAGRELRPFDIVINSTGVGTLGRVAQVWGDLGTATVDSHVTIVRAGERVHPLWLGFALIAKEPEIEHLGEGSTGQTELSRARLGGLQLVVPRREVQDDFAMRAEPLVRKIAANEAYSATLADLRDTLLPKLISGELRVPDPERFLREAGL